MRLAAAIGVIAVALAAAVYVHQRIVWSPVSSACAGRPYSCARNHPSWEDPAAVLLSLGGIAIAAGVLNLPPPSPFRQTFLGISELADALRDQD